VDHVEAASICSGVEEDVIDKNIAEIGPIHLAKKGVVIAGGVVDLAATLAHAEDAADDIGMGLLPLSRLEGNPDVNDVADEEKILALK